jgi:hypothetical protein
VSYEEAADAQLGELIAMEYEPCIGEWYVNPQGDQFQVRGYDPDEGVIEIQYPDGAMDEIELSAWFTQDIEISEPPEDWEDDLDDDDFEDDEDYLNDDEDGSDGWEDDDDLDDDLGDYLDDEEDAR